MREPSPRLNVITGARSGMGKATADLLLSRGERVLGIDLADCDVNADLSARAGREAAVAAVTQACPQGIDALILCAGLGGGMAPGEAVVSVNYFGAVELAQGLRPLLARGNAPRVGEDFRIEGQDRAGPSDPIVFLASPDNRYLVGQVPFCDGGTDVLLRGEEVF